MSLEDPLHKGESLQPKLDAEPAILREESIAPVEVRAEDTESINDVRARLGLSRREALGALAGAVAVPGEVLHAQERSGARLERGASYEEGLAFLRERARTQTTEDLYYFSKNDRGTSWVRVEGSTNALLGSASGAAFAPEDRRYMHRLRRMVAGGETVEMLHTHPTRMLGQGLDRVDTRLLAAVPPSPTDLINMFGAEQGLSEAAQDRLSFSVVSENGTWTYKAEGRAPLTDAVAAGAPYFEELSGPLASYARPAAGDIRDAMEPLLRNVPNGRGLLRATARSIEDGSFVENLRLAPADMAMKRWLLKEVVANPQTSREGKRYIETILRAADAIDTASKAQDPDGYTIEQMLGRIPQVADAESGFTEYQEFWKKRGVSLSFKPF